MDRFVIEGGVPLRGRIAVSGAKNAALPAMAAALLSFEPLHLTNVPRVRDIFTMKDLLQHMGVAAEPADLQPDGELKLCAERIVRPLRSAAPRTPPCLQWPLRCSLPRRST